MQVKSLPECSKGSILQYFQPSLSYHLSSRPLFCLFFCGGFRQVSDSRETSLSLPVKYFTDLSKAVLLLWIIYVFSVLYLLCLCVRLFICALWSPAGKGLTSWLYLWVCHFPIGILGQVWYLIVSVPDLCTLTYFYCTWGPYEWTLL